MFRLAVLGVSMMAALGCFGAGFAPMGRVPLALQEAREGLFWHAL